MKQLPLYLSFIREYFFPFGCALCGETLLDAEETWYGLCRDCMARFAVSGEERCSSCGRPLISEKDCCLPCREGELRAYDRIVSLFPYTGKYRRLLGAYKFGAAKTLGNFFLEKILTGLSLLPLGEMKAPVLTPVPPRPGKIKKTGWDQISYLAKLLNRSRRAGKQNPSSGINGKGPEAASSAKDRGPFLPVYPCLKRLPSRSQKKLNREERTTNLKGRILCIKKVPPELILFDDVITTGSTMDACAAALKEAGAERVYGICLFYD
jgi:predicted amidophosphoribosyltransferase